MDCKDVGELADETRKKWRAVLGALEIQIGNKADFDAFLADIKAYRTTEDRLTLVVSNGFVAEWIRQRTFTSIKRTVYQVFGKNLDIVLKVAADLPAEQDLDEALSGDHHHWSATRMRQHQSNLATRNARDFPLRDEMTFDRFQQSECNNVAVNSARNVAEDLGRIYNPLTVLAETGQGKTHLLQAIAHQARGVDKNVIYINAEVFINDFVTASQDRKVSALRERYLALDVLMVDGIEKLIGKQETQKFFLDIIDHLIANDRQVVIAGNNAHQLKQLPDEVLSRISGGLEVFINPPDLALKRALLKQHSIERGLKLMSEALDFLANRTVSSCRELVGGIARVAAHVSLLRPQPDGDGAIVTRAVAAEAVRDRLTAPSPKLSAPENVIRAVAEACDVDAEKIRRTGRGARKVSDARDVAIYMLREKCGLTMKQTGDYLGGRNHSTIIAALDRYSKKRDLDLALIHIEQEVERILSQNKPKP